MLDDDGPGNNRAIAISNPVLSERGGTAVFDIELSQPSTAPITLNYQT